MTDEQKALRARATVEKTIGVVSAKANVIVRPSSLGNSAAAAASTIVVLCADSAILEACKQALARQGVKSSLDGMPVRLELRPAPRRPGDKGGLSIRKGFDRIVIGDK